MNLTYIPHRRALAVLVPATLLLAAPAVAQDTATSPIQTTTTPPPPPAAAPEASAPPVATPMTNGVAARNGIGDPNSTTQIAPEAMTQAEEARAARPRAATPTRAPASRAITRDAAAPVSSSPAIRPTAPTAASDPATTASTAPEAPTPAAPAPAAAAPGGVESATTGSAATDTAAATEQGSPVWPWLLGGLVVLGALLALFLRRRRHVVAEDEDVYVEPVDASVAQQPFAQPLAEPAAFVPVAAETSAPPPQPARSVQSQSQGHGRLEPQFLRTTAAAAAPVVAASIAEQVEAQAVEAELAEPEPQDVAELTAGSAHGDRPWLEFALRPVRAGSDAEAAVVEIELTVGNLGTVAAQEVRISTFMFTDQSASRGDMERLLAEHSADSEVVPVTIAPGEGTRVDATLSLPRDRFADDARTFNPVILADARYRMADGSEGRTSASFTIGGVAVDGDDLRGIAIYPTQMSDDIEARLHGEVAHT